MRNMTLDNSLSIHITKSCNLRCNHCYQEDNYSGDIKLEYAYSAIEKIKPEYIVLYGGEAILRPALIKNIIKTYPDKKYILHSNGTIINEEILDTVDYIYLTVDSLLFDRIPKYKHISKKQFDNMISIIKNYKDKIIVIHNIYPTNNDNYFYDMAGILGLNNINTYPIITNSHDFEVETESIKYLPFFDTILTKPKLRVLTDGTITRDMRGVYNICHVDKWKDRYKKKELPIHKKCKKCRYFKKCPACNEFPHFCKDILDINPNPHFCKFTEEVWKNYQSFLK